MSRPSVTFLAWAPTAGRAKDLANELGGLDRCIYPLSDRRLVPLRYLVSSVLTVAHLVRHRPRSVVVQNPPVYPAMIVWAYAKCSRSRFLLDNHPASFGAKDNTQAKRMIAITRWLARRSDGVLVTTPEWVEVVESWGAQGLVLHEAPPMWSTSDPGDIVGRPRILFSCVFAKDEPVAEVMDAAAQLPDFDIRVTGDPRRASTIDLDALPANVTLTGWLDQAAYAAEVEAADVLLALTTEPTSVMRAAYEGAFARRPMVLTDWPALTELFPESVFVPNTTQGIKSGLQDAVKGYTEMRSSTPIVANKALRRWVSQCASLRLALGLTKPDGLGTSGGTGAAARIGGGTDPQGSGVPGL